MKAHLTILKGDTTNIVLLFIVSRQITLCNSCGQLYLRKLLLLMVTAVKIKSILRKIKPLYTKLLCHH